MNNHSKGCAVRNRHKLFDTHMPCMGPKRGCLFTNMLRLEPPHSVLSGFKVSVRCPSFRATATGWALQCNNMLQLKLSIYIYVNISLDGVTCAIAADVLKQVSVRQGHTLEKG
jgi:hypothetical protein